MRGGEYRETHYVRVATTHALENAWAAYLIAERGVPVEAALKNAEAINLMGHMSMGPQPVEDFLGRRLPELDHK